MSKHKIIECSGLKPISNFTVQDGFIVAVALTYTPLSSSPISLDLSWADRLRVMLGELPVFAYLVRPLPRIARPGQNIAEYGRRRA